MDKEKVLSFYSGLGKKFSEPDFRKSFEKLALSVDIKRIEEMKKKGKVK